jgi:hypothetical protein
MQANSWMNFEVGARFYVCFTDALSSIANPWQLVVCP